MLLQRPLGPISVGPQYVYLTLPGAWKPKEVRQILKYANHSAHRHFFASQARKRITAFEKARDRKVAVLFSLVGSPRLTGATVFTNSYAFETLVSLCEFNLAEEMTKRCMHTMADEKPYVDYLMGHTGEYLFPLINGRLQRLLIDTADLDIMIQDEIEHKSGAYDIEALRSDANVQIQSAAGYINQVAHDFYQIEPWCKREDYVPDPDTGHLAKVLR